MNVTIQQDIRMLVDVPNIEVDLLFAEGGLVFDAEASKTYELKARQIISNAGVADNADMIGRLMDDSHRSVSAASRGVTVMTDSVIQIGTAEEPWACDGSVTIRLMGDKWQTEIGAPDSAVVIGKYK